ncbi:unnamed protein product, partial [Musa acuminata var. zebrina]
GAPLELHCQCVEDNSMASKFFASFGLLIVFCASEARGNLPQSSHQPRRARHDVRELRRGVGRRHALCAREERARGAAGGVHLRRVGDRRRGVQRLGRDGLVRGGVRARPGHRRDLLGRAAGRRLHAEALIPGLLPWLPNVLDLYFNLAAVDGTMQSVHLITRE